MFGYVSLSALVLAFLLVIILHAFFARRMMALRDRGVVAHGEYQRLRTQVAALAEEVGELQRGAEGNEAAIKGLETTIEELRQKIAGYQPEQEIF